jgi:hypothetical protein
VAAGSLTTQVVPNTGLAITTSTPTATDGDTCATGAGVFLYVSNTSGSSINVTLATPGTVDGDLAIADRTVAVANSATTLIPLTSLYRNPATGRALVTCSATTGVAVAVLRVPTS